MLAIRAKAELELRKRRQQEQDPAAVLRESRWFDDGTTHYVNRERGFVFEPANEECRRFAYGHHPRQAIFGGEGSGKTVHAIISVLERLRKGASVAMATSEFEHVKKLWPEVARWIPWHAVSKRYKRMGDPSWEPSKPFSIEFRHNGHSAFLWVGGMQDPRSWDGINVNTFWIDELWRCGDETAIIVAESRARIPTPLVPSGVIYSSTPMMNWMFDCFGPIKENDRWADYKRGTNAITISAEVNRHRLDAGQLDRKREMLTDAQAEVLIHGRWAQMESRDRFLPSMATWDICRADLPPLGRNEACVAAIDAGVVSDNFAFIIVSRSRTDPESHVWVRVVRVWEPKNGRELDFAAIEREIIELCHHYAIYEVAYDGYQMVQMAQNLRRQDINVREFSQGADRRTADKNLGDVIIQRKLQHDGDPMLRRHIDNADRKVDTNDSGYRLVKRADSLKIDAAVALSMAVYRCFKLNLA
jgi:hypothetical protein